MLPNKNKDAESVAMREKGLSILMSLFVRKKFPVVSRRCELEMPVLMVLYCIVQLWRSREVE